MTESQVAANKRYRESNRQRFNALRRKNYLESPFRARTETKRWRDANPNRVKLMDRAKSLVRHAIKRGDITRPDDCFRCGRQDIPIEAAHSDYTRPLDVTWLCRPCHRAWDQKEPKS